MARHMQIKYVGSVYHVLARGNQGQAIFANDRNCSAWVQTLGEASAKTGWRIHAWVLMVSERLRMEEESGVSRVVRWVKAGRGGELRRLEQRLSAGASSESKEKGPS